MVLNPTCVDLFCGAGGFSLGFEWADFNIIAAVDRSKPALKTYNANFDNVSTFERNIHDFNAETLNAETEYTTQEVDIVIGGPPCKGFSHAGQMDADDPRNELVVEYANTVADLDPEVVVIENVSGILHMCDGAYKKQVRKMLQDLGYTVPEPEILTAADYGVPQLRERVIFMASKHGSLKLPTPTHYSADGQDLLDSTDDLNQYVPVEDAIGDLSFLDYGKEASEYRLRPLTDYQKEMREGADTLYNHKAPNHGETVRNRYKQFDHGDTMSDIPQEYQTSKHTMIRWHPRQPSPTVTTLPEDFIHYNHNRIPTVREIARIQSFPDTFVFKGPRTTGGKRRKNTVPQYTQVGNAVPPKFAESLGNQVLRHLQEVWETSAAAQDAQAT